MSATFADRVVAALDTVQDPCSIATRRPLSIVELGLLVGLEVDETGDVDVVLRPTSMACWLIASIMEAVEERVAEVDGARTVTVRLDHSVEWTPEAMTPAGAAKLAAARKDAHERLGVQPRGALLPPSWLAHRASRGRG